MPGGSLAVVQISHIIVGFVNASASGGYSGTGHAVALIPCAQDGFLYVYDFGRKSFVLPYRTGRASVPWRPF